MNPLYQQMGMGQLSKSINDLKKRLSDPNKAIQDLLNSGKVSQQQYDEAVKKARQIMGMLR